ncbi:MAG: hypothetical protein R3C68_02450 [Myxococcota bacterium]
MAAAATLVVADAGFAGMVIRCVPGEFVLGHGEEAGTIQASAGVEWDDVVRGLL